MKQYHFKGKLSKLPNQKLMSNSTIDN